MGLFSIFGDTSSTSTSQTQVDVEVNPQIGVTSVNLVDLEPIQKLVDNLAGAQVASAEFQAAGLSSLGASIAAGQRDVALAQAASTRNASIAQGEGFQALSGDLRELMLVIAVGAGLWAFSGARA